MRTVLRLTSLLTDADRGEAREQGSGNLRFRLRALQKNLDCKEILEAQLVAGIAFQQHGLLIGA
jgi:hypothetical protein